MNKSFENFCRKASIILERLSIWAAGVFVIINLLDISIAVFFRYLFNKSWIGTEEIARFTLIWAVMFAANSALRCGEHVSITFLDRFLPDLVKIFLKWFKRLLIIFITGLMTYLSIKYVSNAWVFKTIGLKISKAIPLMAIPIGTGLFLVQYILIQIAPPDIENPIDDEVKA
ncbi:TRAP transporter small permease [Halanaerobaculum tunisiense]